MNRGVSPAPEWDCIDTVLLDMDGTLLDKHFDDHFWGEHVPLRYAQARDISLDEARTMLMDRYRSVEGTLDWTDLDRWSEKLDLDIPSLKRQVDHLIDIHPYVESFLDRVRGTGKELILVTNAHGKTLDLKMEKTALAGKFDRIFTSHQMGAPKEQLEFWTALRESLGFDPARTLLGEDTEACLESAARFGIRYLVYIAKASSTRPVSGSDRFFSIETFREIMP